MCDFNSSKTITGIKKHHLVETNCSFVLSEQKGYDVIITWRNNKEVDNVVVIKPKTEVELGDERRKQDEGKQDGFNTSFKIAVRTGL